MYRRDRYLEYASHADLDSRARDIIGNSTTLTSEGQIGALNTEVGGEYWLELFTHVLEERALRCTGFSAKFMRESFVPNPTFPAQPAGDGLLRQLGLDVSDRPYFAKLGKAEYLEATFREGRWRISPASTYAATDPSLSLAQRDSELQMSVCLPKCRVTVWDGSTGGVKREIEPRGNIRLTYELSSDYYVSCLAKQLDLRLFDDFKADSCIVIHDPTEFAKRIFRAAKELLPQWFGMQRDVVYVDPFQPPMDGFDLFFSKHFKYWYQKEVRFAWIPDKPADNLNHLVLEMGSISDIAQFAKL